MPVSQPDDHILHITLKRSLPPGNAAADGSLPTFETPPLLRFKGPADMPFLAPRGVWMTGGLLVVSDTGRNRVFVWRQRPLATFQEPDLVLGQDDAQAVGRNAGGQVSAHTLQYPSGVWSDGQRLMVADAWNHRVLIWHTLPTHPGQAADVVVGQPDFHSNQPNVTGVGAAPNGQSLYWPYGLYSDGQSLWIADTGNRRVLYFACIPTTNYPCADAVLGKPDLTSRDYESDDPIWPYSVKIGPAGELAITDTQYYRVLLWKHWRAALTEKAHCIIGQPDLVSNGQNQYGLYPQAHTLNWCYDTAFDRGGLWVADTGNSRLLRFDSLPTQPNAPANAVLGKPNFYTGSENANTLFGTDHSLYWPFALCADNQLLAVADTGNHQIVFYQL